MSRFTDSFGNIVDTTGQNQPAINAAVQPGPDAQSIPPGPGGTGKVIAPTYITTNGVSVCAILCNPS